MALFEQWPSSATWNGPVQPRIGGGYEPAPIQSGSSFTTVTTWPPVHVGRHRKPEPPRDWNGCTCGQAWNAIIPPPPCPSHGSLPSLKVWC